MYTLQAQPGEGLAMHLLQNKLESPRISLPPRVVDRQVFGKSVLLVLSPYRLHMLGGTVVAVVSRLPPVPCYLLPTEEKVPPVDSAAPMVAQGTLAVSS